MAATNLGCTWRYNLFGATEPFRFPGSFVAGATTAIKSGEILVLAATTWAPLGADQSNVATIAVMDNQEIRSGDLAGYHPIIIPRPGDVFEYALSAAAAPAIAAPLYWSTSQILATSGSNALAYVVDESIFPQQGFQSVNPSFDAGTTIRTVSKVLIVFKASVSYWLALQVA